MAMIEAPFCFFQVKMERCIGDAFKFGEPDFCKSPEALDPIDMDTAFWELVLRMIYSKVSIA